MYYDKKDGYILSAKACDLAINIGDNPVVGEKQVNMIKLFYDFVSVSLPCNYCQAINIKYDKQIICVN